MEQPPAIVPTAQQAGATYASWQWVKPCVWTLRMLTALITRVEGMKWFRLFDKVFSERNLLAAFQQVARKKGAAGVDHVTVDEFEHRLPDSIWELTDQLKTGTYRPQAVRRVQIPKPGSNETRPLGIPTVAAYCTSFNKLWKMGIDTNTGFTGVSWVWSGCGLPILARPRAISLANRVSWHCDAGLGSVLLRYMRTLYSC